MASFTPTQNLLAETAKRWSIPWSMMTCQLLSENFKTRNRKFGLLDHTKKLPIFTNYYGKGKKKTLGPQLFFASNNFSLSLLYITIPMLAIGRRHEVSSPSFCAFELLVLISIS